MLSEAVLFLAFREQKTSFELFTQKDFVASNFLLPGIVFIIKIIVLLIQNSIQMKKSALIIALVAFISIPALLFTSCQKDESGSKGTLHLSITDAPIDMLNVDGVFISINEVQYNHNGTWKVLEPFEAVNDLNLLDLQHGLSSLLGTFELEAGTYTQIRFMLEAPEMGSDHANPGCYMTLEDGTVLPLFVPSGAQTGYKATGEFAVPVNGDVYLTADFDVRKSIVVAGASGKYILKPTIRLVAENQAGTITGTVTNAETDVVVYAYETETYTDTEAGEPAEGASRFPSAISSDLVDEEGNFTLAFMAAGTYDLVVVSTTEGAFTEVLGIVEGVEVTSQETTTVDIDVTAFE